MQEMIMPNGTVTMVDDEDYEKLSKKKWSHNTRTNYIQGTKYLGKVNGKYKQQTIYMHVLIMGSPDGKQVDHIDGNKLNNQKSNLRVCSRLENNRNKATVLNKACKYKGVTQRDINKYPHRPYRARITYDGKKRLIGDFRTQEEAATAYNQKAKEVFGEFARLNAV